MIRDNLHQAGALSLAINVCDRHGVPLDYVLGKSRLAPIVKVRHELWGEVRTTLGLSYRDVGRIFDVNHSSVESALRSKGACW